MNSEANLQQTIGRLSERYGVSAEAVETLAHALTRSGGRLAQFDHPELGGYGQWMPGMTQIGDMFNRPLRDRVGRLCQDLSAVLCREDQKSEPSERSFSSRATADAPARGDISCMEPMKPMEPMQGMKPMEPMKPMEGMKEMESERWWPASLGDSPNSAGGQNKVRYAYFGEKNRLAVDRGDGKIEIYDTGAHHITGVDSSQSNGSGSLEFTSDKGKVDLASLHKVDADS